MKGWISHISWLVRCALTESTYRVNIDGYTSDAFSVGVGLQQHDLQAPLLFSIALKAVVNAAEVDQGGSTFNKIVQTLVNYRQCCNY